MRCDVCAATRWLLAGHDGKVYCWFCVRGMRGEVGWR